VDVGGRTVLPGAVDVHVHGGAGAAFTETDPERLRSIVRLNREQGVTTMVGGLVAASPADTLAQVAALAELTEAGEIAGSFLEGPWISEHRHGAHDPALLREPDLAEFDRIVKAGRGSIRMITVAPELPGALDLIRAAASEGITVAVGHTEATYDQARAAFDAGATMATHLYNAMRPFNHREPGPIGAVLNDERVVMELINDGVHVHPGAAQVAFDAAGSERIALVTDAMAATGLGDGTYSLGKLEVRVEGGRALLADGTIASSTIVLPEAIRRMRHDRRSGGAPPRGAGRARGGPGRRGPLGRHRAGPGPGHPRGRLAGAGFPRRPAGPRRRPGRGRRRAPRRVGPPALTLPPRRPSRRCGEERGARRPLLPSARTVSGRCAPRFSPPDLPPTYFVAIFGAACRNARIAPCVENGTSGRGSHPYPGRRSELPLR